MLRTPTTNISKTYWIVANTSAIIISYIGAALSVLWIIMVKGSKAWFEIYEAAIAAYEENNKYINKVKGNNKINPRWSLFAFQNQLDYRTSNAVCMDNNHILPHYLCTSSITMLVFLALISAIIYLFFFNQFTFSFKVTSSLILIKIPRICRTS